MDQVNGQTAKAIGLIASCDVNEIRQYLNAMKDAYLLQKEGEMEYPKKQVHSSWYVLDEFLKKLQEQKTLSKMP